MLSYHYLINVRLNIEVTMALLKQKWILVGIALAVLLFLAMYTRSRKTNVVIHADAESDCDSESVASEIISTTNHESDRYNLFEEIELFMDRQAQYVLNH